MPKQVYPDKPTLSWLSWNLLSACHRRYFLYSFAYELTGQYGYDIQCEKKLSFWNAWSGQLADDGISAAIRHFKEHRVWKQDMGEWLRDRARIWVKDSRAWRDAARAGAPLPRDLETQPIEVYFFGTEPDKAAHLEVLERAQNAMRYFYASDVPGRIEAASPDGIGIRESKEFPWTYHDGVPVYASYDFVLRTPEKTTIFDWKTGKLNQETELRAIEQLHWYANHVERAWDVPIEQIRLAPVFLGASSEYEEIPPNRERMAEIRAEWSSKHQELVELKRQSKSVEDLQERFPMTENLSVCAGCVFRTCPGYRRIAEAEAGNPVKLHVRGDID